MDDTSSYLKVKLNFNEEIISKNSSQSTTNFSSFKEELNKKISHDSLINNSCFNTGCNSQDYYDYVINSMKIIISISFLFNSSNYQDQLSNIRKKTKELFQDSKSSILCFDLDETLIISKETKDISFDNNYDFTIKSNSDNFIVGWIRPGVIELLKFCKKMNLILCIFSAANLEYINFILEAVNISVYFDNVFCRDYCIKFTKNLYIKDLSALSLNIDNIMIIENSLVSFSPHLENGILVNSFNGEKNDCELFEIIEHLKLIVDDQGSVSTKQNEKFFRFNEIKKAVERNY